MKTNRLGSTRVEVSVLGFGAAPIGNLFTAVDDDVARLAVDAAWDSGIRYFDTAPHYGLGLSEQRLGAALIDRDRQDFVLSTKVGRVLVHNPRPTGSDLPDGRFDVPDLLARRMDYTREGVLRSLDDSLRRLSMDRVDIVYVHDPEEHMDDALHQAVPTLVELRDQGVVGAIGVGINLVDPARRFVAETDIDVVMIAGRWTLADRSAEPLLAECEARQVSVVAAAPFNSGLLAHDWPSDGATFDYLTAPPHVLSHARELAAVCRRFGVALPQAALQFPLEEPIVASVVAGMRSAEQADGCARWINQELPPAAWEALKAVAPDLRS